MKKLQILLENHLAPICSVRKPLSIICAVMLFLVCILSLAQDNVSNEMKGYTVAFQNFVFRESGDFDISIGSIEMDIVFTEELRRQGYNALGYEDLAIGINRADQARMLLGGEAFKIDCTERNKKDFSTCVIDVKWTLFDTTTVQNSSDLS
ncbi:MAG: hypothetical protein QNJ97_27660 [Myxococcota bacterium]|nr:hypothetical protein [Myxococcota bacterium]